MLKHQFYYTLKPYLPWRMRMTLRRITAQRLRRQSRSFWPIDEAAGRAPESWSGWPDGKKFAFVITHDVEGPGGLAKCRQLAELEIALGIRSCFNFIPEGSYAVPESLRTWLTDQGFEVGVHDLNHDGRLFSSKAGFTKKAARINQHLKAWNASGFRGAFMLRELDWLHALDVGYDSSTFDTDPFELQSDGAGTIFPYWVPPPGSAAPGIAPGRQQRKGYVELPYTLAQDSTLFLVLGETSPATWIQKLDWVADRGGMALVNVHPDYICFDGERPSPRTYPVAYYREFLEYAIRRYGSSYWPALPKTVFQYAAATQPATALRRRRRVCMVTHSFYETDNRVTRYAEALAARGDQVDVIALRRSPSLPLEHYSEGVRIFRIQDRFSKSQRSKLSFLWPLVRFLLKAAACVARRSRHDPYDVVHVHNMPDFLVFAALYPKLHGARVILDIHDIVPEFYGSKFAAGKSGVAVAGLRTVEKWSAKFADHIIISNHLWFEKFAARTGTRDRCSVFINNVDSRVFQPTLRTRHDDKLIILFPGGLEWHQGLDIALNAFKTVSAELPQAEFHIYGDGIMKPSLVALAAELGFKDKVRFFEPVKIKEIAQVMANADLGVVPKRADSFGNEAYSTKIMEFMSLGVPVVISKTKIDQYYFNDSVVRFFESGNVAALATAMLDVLRDAALRRKLIANALLYAEQNSWNSRKGDYLAIVDGLIGQPTLSGETLHPSAQTLSATPAI